MATNKGDFYTTPYYSEICELLENKGFVNTEDQTDNPASPFHIIINTRRSVFFVCDVENLERNQAFAENLGEILNPTTLKEIEQWQN